MRTTLVDTFKNHLLYFIESQSDLGGTSWDKIDQLLLHTMGAETISKTN
jgi:hypothetical protein